MDAQLEHVFRLWEEYDLEVDADLKAELRERFHSETEAFLQGRKLPITRWDFFHAVRDDYKNWKRNKH
jgi:hypothetical protein